MIAVVDGAAKPGLRPAEEGQSDVAANNQPLSSIDGGDRDVEQRDLPPALG